MSIKEKIEQLRRNMREWGWDAAITVGQDPHDSEYTPSRWCQRQFISGFTGSAGVVVVTMDHAGLWTDFRYWIQADAQLAGTCLELHKMTSVEDRDWMKWTVENLKPGAVVGVDGLCFGMNDATVLQDMMVPKGQSLVSRPDYLDAVWKDRPGLPDSPAWVHEDCYAGRSLDDKLSWLRGVLAERSCTYMFVSCLDQISWLLNLRAPDIDYSPMLISFALVGPERVELFALKRKFSPELTAMLEAHGICLHDYASIGQFIASQKFEGRILIDPATLNFETGKAIEGVFGKDNMVYGDSPIDLEKAIKNPVEIEGFRKAYLRDGVAQTRFYFWLEKALAAGETVTEWSALEKLHELRAKDPDFLDESFETISAYGTNAAIVHYETEKEHCAKLEPRGLYMNDSGAHYRFGTTDITRTVPLGPVSDLEREDYTLDMIAMIELSTAIFPAGTPGCRLDAVCLRPLWQAMRNFGHGTGHGVGNVLGVHEGPQTIRQNLKPVAMMPGMITSNEPGIYREGMHGVRHENMILCREHGTNGFGEWLSFETLTRTYLDTGCLDLSLMRPDQIEWLNEFNATVYRDVSPYLNEEEKRWLASKTAPVGC